MGICMCPGITTGGVVCPHKETCYRHTRTPNEYCQAWWCNPPLDIATGGCEYYIFDERVKGETK